MVYVAVYSIAKFSQVAGRVCKPFNPMLGETFEVVTPTYRAFTEQVSHHPPINAIVCQGEGFELLKTVNANIKFTGKSIAIQETDKFFLSLFHKSPEEELYTFTNPKIMVGNLIIGDAYIEPTGACSVTNHKTGETAEIDFKARGWTAKSRDIVSAVIKDSKGVKKFTLQGKFTEALSLTNLDTNETTEVWRSNPLPENASMMFNLNSFAL